MAAAPAQLGDLNGVFSKFISGALVVIGILSIIMIVIGGINYIGSGGDKEGMAKAKATLTFAILGLVIAVSAWMILNVFASWFGLKTINEFNVCFEGKCP